MEDLELYAYAKKYFTLVDAAFRPADEFALCVELPRDVDKELTDRPFYWMWVETLRETPPPSVLYLLFSDQAPTEKYTANLPENTRPERVIAGSYRMQKIFQSAKKRGMFAVAYEHAAELWPFVLINLKVSFASDRQRDELITYLVDLQTNQVTKSTMLQWVKRNLSDERPRNARIMPLPVNYERIFQSVLERARQDLAKKDPRWAKEASERLKKELDDLEKYYADLPDQDQHNNEKKLRKEELSWRMAPRVEVQPFQLALLYLANKG